MAFIIDDIVKGFGKKKAAKEQYKKQEEEATKQYGADKATFANQESSRQPRASFIADQLKGARALPPEVVAAIRAAKVDPSFKHSVVDQSKGVMWNAAGDALGSAANLGGLYLKGAGMPQQNAGTPTSLRPPMAPDTGANVGGLGLGNLGDGYCPPGVPGC